LSEYELEPQRSRSLERLRPSSVERDLKIGRLRPLDRSVYRVRSKRIKRDSEDK